MLAGQQAELLPEACALLEQARRRLPPELLPAALDAGARSTSLRPLLAPVLGARGCWLARFNANWQWLTTMLDGLDGANAMTAETVWNEGTPAQRLAAFRRVRAEDPSRARAWIAETWKSEKADFRAAVVEALADGLSTEDEPFLQAAMDDRSHAVRTAAAALLARLPASALAQRMCERADTLLDYKRSTKPILLRFATGKVFSDPPGRLVVTPPEAWDRGWQDDGIEEKPPSDVGARAWWLIQLLALIPPAHWQARFAVPAEDLIAAAEKDEWRLAVLEGWTRAAIAHRDVGWAEAVWSWWLRFEPSEAEARYLLLIPELLRGLLQCLPVDVVRRLADGLWTETNSVTICRWLDLLPALPVPWSTDFAQHYLVALRKRISTGDARSPAAGRELAAWLRTLAVAALALPPVCFSDALQEWIIPETADWREQEMRRAIDHFVETIRTRQRLRDAFEEDAQ